MRSTRHVWALTPMLLLVAPMSPAFGDTAHFTVEFTTTTTDFHMTAGSGTGFKIVKITGPGGVETPPSSSNGTDPPSGAYNAAWTTAPGPGTYTIDVNGHMGSDTGWGGKYWLTTDGILKRPGTANTGVFASIYPVFDPTFSTVSLYAFNNLPGGTLDIGSFQATVVTDPSSINLVDWMAATGQTYSFAESVLGPDSAALFLGTIPFNNAGWLKITATVNGLDEAMGYSAASAAPEPYMAPLIGSGLLLLGLAGRKRRLDSTR